MTQSTFHLTPSTPESEVLPFVTDPAIIYSVICKQAGTRGKALAELAQNLIDAKATVGHFTITKDGFIVSDDGIGFASLEEIKNNFLTFGRPHQQGDSTFGRFRLGRGQIMVYATTVWRTGTWEMHVDIKNKGLDVRIDKNLPFVAGCTITGTWYEPLLESDLRRVEHEVQALFMYAAVPMMVQGKQINKTPDTQKWDLVTDDAYIRYRETGGVELYNLGFLVNRYNARDFGNAIVVSRIHLELNMARNDVLESECGVWKRIRKELQSQIRRLADKSPKVTEEVRSAMVRSWYLGEISFEHVENLKMFTDVQGGHHTLLRMLKESTLVVSPRGNRVAETVHRRQNAFVLASISLERFGVETLEGLRDQLIRLLTRDGQHWFVNRIRDIELSDLATVSKGIDSGYVLLRTNELEPNERVMLATLNRYQEKFVWLLNASGAFREPVKARTIRVGVSETAHAWTDGRTYIAIGRDEMKIAVREGYLGIVQLLPLLVHEYIHDTNDQDSHEHDHQFFQTFHDVFSMGLRGHDGLFDHARSMFATYYRNVRKVTGKAPATTADDVDRFSKSGVDVLADGDVDDGADLQDAA